jgi:hypothetical protein
MVISLAARRLPPRGLYVGIVAISADADATPSTRFATVKGLTGSVQLRYPDFLPTPNVALAYSFYKGSVTFQNGKTRSGLLLQSRNAQVLIRR